MKENLKCVEIWCQDWRIYKQIVDLVLESAGGLSFGSEYLAVYWRIVRVKSHKRRGIDAKMEEKSSRVSHLKVNYLYNIKDRHLKKSQCELKRKMAAKAPVLLEERSKEPNKFFWNKSSHHLCRSVLFCRWQKWSTTG